jgi:hypothetical protein
MFYLRAYMGCRTDTSQVGIYMLIDVNSPLAGQSIDSSAPSASYDASYLNRTFAVVEAFKDYPNTLMFFAGNEVINDVATGGSVPPYIRVSSHSLQSKLSNQF